jgi:hypothetical protein
MGSGATKREILEKKNREKAAGSKNRSINIFASRFFWKTSHAVFPPNENLAGVLVESYTRYMTIPLSLQFSTDGNRKIING